MVKTVEKPWGKEEWFADNEHYIGKLITIKNGHRLSKQYHRKKHETIYVLSGVLMMVTNDVHLISPGESVSIKPRSIHRFSAPSGDVVLIEVSTPHGKDVVRLDDDYGRK